MKSACPGDCQATLPLRKKLGAFIGFTLASELRRPSEMGAVLLAKPDLSQRSPLHDSSFWRVVMTVPRHAEFHQARRKSGRSAGGDLC
ncbi:hypothetical protein SAMN05421753_104308 [Planctomicrobium piriforme]|uniref:Uncharacterized protein n=1 Tax=Planctomicrobium piriforme TaxID=1576369 RepID=A0A1I3ENQ6_9PLAN|nr:hypothetical protein SAMN05421753_104308 [Planctomicrobium piriforme]